MAGRQPINTDFGDRGLVTQARPIAQTHSRQQAPDMRGWESLANTFAQGELLAGTLAKQKREDDENRAKAWANSLTVEELGKKVKSGEMLASESPVFAATVQHIYGRNQYDALERDVIGKVTTGEMVFKDAGAVDAYLTQARNDLLQDQGEYTIAGFDKGFTGLRPKMMDAVSKYNDKQYVEEAAIQSGDALRNRLLHVTAEGYSGTHQDAAADIIQEYQFLRLSKTLPDAAAKDTLKETLAAAAASGRPQLVEAMLAAQLPDLGSVRGFLGEQTAITLGGQAGAQFDQQQRQRIDEESAPWYEQASAGTMSEQKFREWATSEPNKKYTTAAFVQSLIDRNAAAIEAGQRDMQKASMQAAIDASEAEARARVDAALTNGTLFEAQGTNTPQVLKANGETKDFDVKGYAEQSLKARTANMPFDQQVSAWAMNGLAHPDWDNQLKAGLHNLASIAVDSKGKPTGQLNEASQKALALFRELDGTNASYARQIAGDTAYNRFSDITFLTHLGRTPEDAAAIAANASSGVVIGSDVGKTVGKIQSAAAELVGNPWYKPAWFTRYFGDNTSHNTVQVAGMVRRYATLLAHSGQYGDADSAINAAAQYLGDPKVSAKINGTLYLRSELPQVPQGGTQEEWVGRFITEGPKAEAVRRGFNAEEMRLEYNPATKGFTPMMGGLPMLAEDGTTVLTYTREGMQDWFTKTRKADIQKAVVDKGFTTFQSRINNEIGHLQRTDKYVMERYDPTYYGQGLNRQILSREAYERIVKDGNQNLPLADLMKRYPAKRAPK